jgi:hypothetical protein
MGLMDRYAAFVNGPEVDLAAEIGAALGQDDRLVVHTAVVPSAYRRGGGGGISLSGKLLNVVTSAVENSVSGSRHIGGDEGSIARTLPREGGPYVLALSTQALTLWDFGMALRTVPGDRLVTVPRAQVTSVEDTGTTAQGGVPVARITFADGSYFDYRLVEKPSPETWAALRTV